MKHIHKITAKNKWTYVATLLTSGCWAYSLATRFTDILTIAKIEKIEILVSLWIITCLLSAFLFWILLPPILNSFSKKSITIILGLCILLITVFFLTVYQLPPFPEHHQLLISTQGEKNPDSDGFKIEIISIKTVSLPKEVQKEVPVSQFIYKGTWQGLVENYGFKHEDEQAASLNFNSFMQAGMDILFQTSPRSGMVHVNWDGSEFLIDLYSEKTGLYAQSFKPALNWHDADATRKILVAIAVIADFISLLTLIMAFTLIIKQLLGTRKGILWNYRRFALCIALLLIMQIPAAYINKPVVLENPQLENAIRNMLEQPEGNIRQNQLLTIVKLEASNQEITDLNGIEQLPNLIELDLSENQITDISALASLENLQKLNLSDNDISDLSPLTQLTELEYLNIQSNSSIDSIKPLEYLVNLDTLIMNNVQIGEEISVIENINDLKHLNLRNCGINDLSFITGMNDLEYLNLYSNSDIQDIQPLQNLTNLKTLILANIPISDQINFLENLNQLDYLNLRNTDLVDISPLSNLTNLKYLNLHSNENILSIEPLQNLKNLQSLILRNVPVGDQTEIFSGLSNLQNLNIQNCKITDITFLAQLMVKGALQDDPRMETAASINIRDNDISIEGSQDPYEAIRPYWENISNRQPDELPFYSTILDPTFSYPTGFYDEDFLLEISTDDPDISIHYTLDSSEPTADSPIYSEPILIASRVGEPNLYSAIETVAHDWNQPDEEVFKATIIRAKAINEQTGEASATVTHTYFVGPDIANRYTLPIVSLVVDPDDLFNSETGIYVMGKEFIEFSESDQSESEDQVPENYHFHGIAWERPIHFELLEKDGQTVFSQNGGVRIHGSSSRQKPQKSLRIYARYEYDRKDTFEYALFDDPTEESSESDDSEYQVFLLRNSGQDWMTSMMRDTLAQDLVSNMDVDTQASRPVIVFLDGEYWGIYHLQERYDEYYLNNHFDVNSDEVTILRNDCKLFKGDQDGVNHYRSLLSFINDNDLSVASNYEYVQTQMDVDNFIDYLIANIYPANTDWPHNNLYFWRKNTDEYTPNAPDGQDGRWRWMLFDLDFGFGFENTSSGYEHDTLDLAQSEDWEGLPFRSLLKNESFIKQFINRFADLLNTNYKTDRVLDVINQAQTVLNPETDEFFRRWVSNENKFEEWEQEIEGIRLFAQERPAILRQQIIEHFSLNGTVELTVNIDSEKGSIRINSLELSSETMGIENPSTWQGIYFKDIPVTITATPKPGYKFAGWEGLEQAEAEIEIELDQDLNLTAKFVEE